MNAKASRLAAIMAFAWMLLAMSAAAQTVRTVQSGALRAERAGDAPALATLAVNTQVALLQLNGGWAQVQTPGATGLRGWLRASQLDLRPPEVAMASQIETGRRASGNAVVTLGSRSLPPRINRHALIVGIGTYRVDPARPVAMLAGMERDMASALQMARALQVPDTNITLLRDEAATSDGISSAIRELGDRAQVGDRVFVYWSGHGSRLFDATEGGCVESLVPFDLKDVTKRDLARWLQPVGAKADKMLVVYDAGHADIVAPAFRSATQSPIGEWQAKFTPGIGSCPTASTMHTGNLVGTAAMLGLSGQDVVYISASRPDEVSLQNRTDGGLVTSALRQCILGEAVDSDGSGAVSIQEIVDCAQSKIGSALAGNARLPLPHIALLGNSDFVPAWFSNAVMPDANVPAAAAPSTLVPLERVVEQIHEQRDSKRIVTVKLERDRMRIGADALRFEVTSSHAGRMYVAMLGSDRQTLYLLFPNQLDSDNTIRAGETVSLPRGQWSITAAGPPGADRLLVMVADGPRDLRGLRGPKYGAFVRPLTDAQGRSQLRRLLGTNARVETGDACSGSACSDAFGSALIDIEEF